MLIELKEALLVWTDLMEINMVITFVDEFFDRGDMALGIGTTGNEKKRPGIIAAEVAAAWAIIAGWMRIVGQVTPVPKTIRCVA